MEIFLEVYGNNKLREKTAEYVGACGALQPGLRLRFGGCAAASILRADFNPAPNLSPNPNPGQPG